MKIVVVGSQGTLGRVLAKRWNDPRVEARIAASGGGAPETSTDVVVPLNLPDFDVCSRLFVVETISDFRPNVVVNASGINLIDWLESRPIHARNIHAHAVSNLKEAVRRTGALLVQFGCGEVFYRSRLTTTPLETGEKGRTGQNKEDARDDATDDAIFDFSNDAADLPIAPDAPGFAESDKPNPASVYAKTKLESERIAAEAPKSLILRTSALFGESTEYSSGNLVESVLKGFARTRRLSAINDKIVEPLWVVDVLCALKTLLRAGATGLFHLSGGSRGTPFEVAEYLRARCGLKNHSIAGVSTREYGITAPRSAFTALRSEKYGEIAGAYRIPDWRTAVDAFLESRQSGEPF